MDISSHKLWGAHIAEGAKKVLLTEHDLLQITQVTLAKGSRCTVTMAQEGEEKFVVCTLTENKLESWRVEISLFGPREVTFECHGGAVDLFGYCICQGLDSDDFTPPKVVDVAAGGKAGKAKPKATPAEQPAKATTPVKAAQPAQPAQPAKKDNKKRAAEDDSAEKNQPKKQKTDNNAKDAKKSAADKAFDEQKQKKQTRVVKGVKIEDIKAGSGDVARSGKRVSVRYTGRLEKTKKVFDSSGNQPFTFRLGVKEVISGWDIGVDGMKVGEKRKLHIPAKLAYGASGAPPAIPPHADLEFDVELVAVK